MADSSDREDVSLLLGDAFSTRPMLSDTERDSVAGMSDHVGSGSGSGSENAGSPRTKSQYTSITPERFISRNSSNTSGDGTQKSLPPSHYYHSITPHDDPFAIARVSVSRLIASQLFMFAYGLWISSYAIVTLPAESERMFKHDHDIALAGFLAIAGVTQLAGPVAGFFSDKTRTTIGRRRPYLVLGGLIVLPSLLLQWLAREYPDSSAFRILYITAFATSMLALNVMYTAASGVIPDMCPNEQVGQANGIMAAMQALGASSGFLFTFAFPAVGNLYKVYIGLLVVCVPVCVLAIKDNTTIILDDNQNTASNAIRSMTIVGSWTWSDLVGCYYIDRKEFPDFFWLFITRALYYGGCSAQVYLQYLFRDLIVKSDGSHLSGNEPAKYVADLAFIGQVSGAVSAYPFAILSDSIGRKPVVAFACMGLIAIYVGFMVEHNLRIVLMMGAFFGMFNGVYLSVDYALAIDTLPSRSDPAQSLAVWGIASFIGTSIGPAILGPILFLSQTTDPDTGQIQNSLSGYRYALGVSCFWMLLAALALKLIKGAR